MGRCASSAAWLVGLGTGLAVATTISARVRRQRLAGQVVFITGGSRGFGLALACEFAKLDCRIALCARDSEELVRAKGVLKQLGHEIFTVTCDVTNKEMVNAAVQAVLDHYGQIDILINNAGEIMVSPFENLEMADFERAMAVMFWAHLYTTLAILPFMKNRGQGRIVNITSIGGKVSVPHLLSYSCAKAAAVAFSNGIGQEVRRFGIKVTTIVPGLMRTGSHINARFKGQHRAEERWFSLAATSPFVSMNAQRAAQLTVKAVTAGKSEKILGLPAQLLWMSQAVIPGPTAGLLRVANSLLPDGNADRSTQTGRDLNDQHSSIYEAFTALGKHAANQLNQSV